MNSLIQAQKEAFQSILTPESQIPWKILNYDTHCQNMLSTLYRVGDLRDLCITLHLNVHQKRDRLHGVLAIYCLEPTQPNMDILIEDFNRDLHSQVVINFCSPVPPALLDYLAKEVGKVAGAVQKIQKIYEHNLDFISLNNNLLTFDGSTQFANNIYSLIVTMKVQPIIIYQVKHDKRANSIIERVVLDVITRLKQTDLNQDWPTLAILFPDREDDWNPMLLHSNTYVALMHDLYQIKYNKIILDNQVYDMSPQYDHIWQQTCIEPMPKASDLIEKELNDWNHQYQLITQQNNELKNALSNAMDLVPQMNQSKRIVEQHVNIARSIMTSAKQMALDKFYQLGQNIITQSDISTFNLDQIQLDNSRDLDKCRILILLLLNNYSAQDYNKVESILIVKDESLKKALKFIKDKVAFGLSKQQQIATTQNKLHNLLKGITTKVSAHSKGLLKNVQNYLPQREKKSAIVQMIENLFNDELKSEELLDYFKIYDSRTKNYLQQNEIGQLSQFKDIMVCFIEGGCYNEYVELCEYGSTIRRNIIYGASHLYTAEETIKQFAQQATQ